MSANTETTGADRTGCKAPTWCDFDDEEDAGDPRLDVYVKTNDGIYGVVSKEGRRYCSSACRDARLPPIAAPAAHIERRKGQVWADSIGVLYTIVDATPGAEIGVTDGGHRVLLGSIWTTDALWAKHGRLLTDAPPEPLTAKDVFGEIPPGSKFTNDTPVKLASSPPAQEAPKVAPVCSRCGNGSYVSNVAFEQGLIKMCIGCRDNLAVWTRSQHGKPYAGPTRLPRPQLAADWVEDCLPEAGR